jgi:hypothetical protein
MQSEGIERGRLHQETSAVRIVDLVVASGHPDERDLFRVVPIVDEHRHTLLEVEVPTEAAGHLLEVVSRVEVEMKRENVVGGETDAANSASAR